MYAEERQQEILRRARANGRVDVVTLAEEFAVTTETIRRDLTALERAGVLRRVHGGAIPVGRLGFEPALSTRDNVMTAKKERIAKAALAELPERCRTILAEFLREESGDSYRDVARRLGIPIGSIGPTRARCFALLRERLRERGVTG